MTNLTRRIDKLGTPSFETKLAPLQDTAFQMVTKCLETHFSGLFPKEGSTPHPFTFAKRNHREEHFTASFQARKIFTDLVLYRYSSRVFFTFLSNKSSILQKNLYKTCGMQIIFACVFACFAQINLLYSFFFAKIFVPLCPQLDKYGNKVSV